MRAVLFAATAIEVFAFWAINRPTNDMTASMQEWPNVLWFSATLMLLAVAVATFGRMVGGRMVVRASSYAAAGVALSSVANIFEDGFRIEAAFFAFILGTLVYNVAQVALVVAVIRGTAGRRRLLAIVPAGALAGILFFVGAGGPIMLATWFAAAAAAAMLGRQLRSEPAAEAVA